MRFFSKGVFRTGLLGGMILALGGCRPAPPPPFPEARDLNVVIVLIDALRADHLPFYGYGQDTAPFLASLARDSVLFERAIATSSTTAPATASLFTGMHPSEHGVITGFLAHRKLRREGSGLTLNRIPAAVKTMGEIFKAGGYRTFCLSDNLNISEEMGFHRGFDAFHTMRNQTAEAMNRILREWHGDITRGGKYFLYLHYMDPHAPYQPRAPWFDPGGTEQQRLVSAYDSEIHFVDEKLREMFELFGWRDNALVVVLADHGEELRDHGRLGHGKSLYREVIHVPFFFYHPSRREERRIAAPVTTMDLLPTLAALTGLPRQDIWRGENLKPLLDGGTLPDRPLFSELLRRPGNNRESLRSVVSGAWHLIQNLPGNREPSAELYHLDRDWPEKENLITAQSSQAGRLKQALEAFLAGRRVLPPEEVQVNIDQETIDQLHTLGYVE